LLTAKKFGYIWFDSNAPAYGGKDVI